MANHQVTIRHMRNALDLVIRGAMRSIEQEYESVDDPECRAACNELLGHAAEEIEAWTQLDPETGAIMGLI